MRASRCLLTCVAVAACMAAATATSLGNILQRDYTVYVPLPTTAGQALAHGWVAFNGSTTCVPGLGVAYAQEASGPTEQHPLWLYFTPAGQASGAAVLYRGSGLPQNLIDGGFILRWGSGGNHWVSVGFRDGDAACATRNSSLPLGDQLVLNPTGIAQALPLTAADAANQGWVAGSCFSGMGKHWFLDIASFGSMTWEAANLLPIVTMYDEDSPNPTGEINAFFFASSVVQQTLFPPNDNQWEPIPLADFMMCKNFCNSTCTFHDTNFFSTLHIYMNDRADVTCHNDCSIGCCTGQ
jgi:hypothetical protein